MIVNFLVVALLIVNKCLLFKKKKKTIAIGEFKKTITLFCYINKKIVVYSVKPRE